MKTRISTIVIMIFVLITGSVKTSGQQLSLGAKTGIGFATFSNFDPGEGSVTRSPNTMVQGGFVMDYKFGKLIGISVEALYQQKGEVYKSTSSSAKLKLYMNYLTIPIMVKASHSFGNFTIFGGLGPYMGYALNGKLVGLGNDKGSVKLEFGKDNFRRFDVGICIGLGGGIKLGPGNLFLDARYDYGLLDVQQPVDKPEGYKTHCNRNFGISLGYMFHLGK